MYTRLTWRSRCDKRVFLLERNTCPSEWFYIQNTWHSRDAMTDQRHSGDTCPELVDHNHYRWLNLAPASVCKKLERKKFLTKWWLYVSVFTWRSVRDSFGVFPFKGDWCTADECWSVKNQGKDQKWSFRKCWGYIIGNTYTYWSMNVFSFTDEEMKVDYIHALSSSQSFSLSKEPFCQEVLSLSEEMQERRRQRLSLRSLLW